MEVLGSLFPLPKGSPRNITTETTDTWCPFRLCDSDTFLPPKKRSGKGFTFEKKHETCILMVVNVHTSLKFNMGKPPNLPANWKVESFLKLGFLFIMLMETSPPASIETKILPKNPLQITRFNNRSLLKSGSNRILVAGSTFQGYQILIEFIVWK